ncbi:hypothetical protein ACN28C_07600 [Plantactinospora sp. WMMC1484]|uniref:hypothetical protein n=1 Tax=Plantactinospora sp. WMMC1484 TaxID=3404122 RepID=UPI003BF4CBDF
MPDHLFQNLYRDTEGLRWATADQVRERGRKRARRQAVTGVVVVIALVIAGSAGVVTALAGSATPPDRSDVVATPPSTTSPATPSPSAAPPSGTPSAGPSTTAGRNSSTAPSGGSGTPSDADRTGGGTEGGVRVPGAVMLQVSDLPPGYRVYVPEFEGDWQLNFFSFLCDDWSANGPALAYRERYFRSAPLGMQQRTERHGQTAASEYISRLRASVRGCPEAGLEIADEDFAGDDSMFVVLDDAHGWIIVRRGDLVTEIAVDVTSDGAQVRRLAGRAATRLCAGTDAC